MAGTSRYTRRGWGGGGTPEVAPMRGWLTSLLPRAGGAARLRFTSLPTPFLRFPRGPPTNSPVALNPEKCSAFSKTDSPLLSLLCVSPAPRTHPPRVRTDTRNPTHPPACLNELFAVATDPGPRATPYVDRPPARPLLALDPPPARPRWPR